MNFQTYGYLQSPDHNPGLPARVTAVHKERFAIVCQHGDSLITTTTVPRRTCFSRRDPDPNRGYQTAAKFSKQRKKEIW